MSIITIALLIMTGMALLEFLFHLAIGIRKRYNPVHLSFSLICLGAVIYIPMTLFEYYAESVEQYFVFLKVQMFGTGIFMLGLLQFTRSFAAINARIFTITMSIVILLFIAIRAFDPYTLTFTDVKGFTDFALFWGGTVQILDARATVWMYIFMGIVYFLYAFIFYTAVKMFRRGDRRRAIPFMVSMGIFLVAIINDFLVASNVYTGLFLMEVGFIALIVLMSLFLTDEVVQVSVIKEKLSDMELRYQGIYDTTYQLLGLLDREGRLVDANRSALDFSGVTRESVLGNYFWETPWWRDLNEAQEQLKEGIHRAAKGEFVRFETVNRDKNRIKHNIDFSLSPIQDPDGTVRYIVPEGHDISDIHEAREKIQSQNEELAASMEELEATNEELAAAMEELESQNENLVQSQEEIALLYKDLQKSEKKYRTLFEAAGDAFFLMKEDRFIDCNRKTLEIFGCTREQIVDSYPYIFSPGKQPDGRDSKEKALEKINAAMAGEPQFFEWKHQQYNKTLFDALVMLNRIDLDTGTHVLAIVHDISDIKEAEHRFQIIIDNLPVVVWMARSMSSVEFVSANVERVSGFTLDEIYRSGPEIIMNRVHPDDINTVRKNFSNTFTVPVEHENEYRFQRKDGRWIWIHARVRSQYDLGGELVAYGILTEITDRVNAREALELSESRLKEAQNIARVGHFERCIDGDRLTWSEELYTILGIPVEEFDGTWGYLGNLLSAEDKEMLENIYWDSVHTNKSFSLELPMTPPGGEGLCVQIRCRHVYDNGNPVRSIGTILDITELKKVENDLKEAINEKVALLDEKDALLKEIHHRVKNNMQVISSLMGLQYSYLENDRDRELFTESLNRIKTIAMVHEKLYKSKSMARIDFKDYIDSQVLELLNAYNVTGSRISVSVSVDSVELGIDRAVPCGLLVNELLSNAIKHAFPGDRKGEIAVDFRSGGSDYTLEISDNGVGVEDISRLEKSGSLGIKMINALAKQLRGSLSFSNEKGLCCRVTFSEK